ncbi:MAG: hypothetical protein E5Y01_31060 [Mesorhizobium sp.]|nr:MAG: hypothetical protein EOR75_23720 [Mesorhizobium sp.]TJV47855.1 MAG: hypothetical protein E5Y01_31060 [Mesorhizobium sp.]
MAFRQLARLPLLPLWEKVSPKATDEGCSRERQRLIPLEHPSSVSATPSPTRGEGKAGAQTTSNTNVFTSASGSPIA